MDEKPVRSWWRRRRLPLLAAGVGSYLLFVSPLCWGLRIYWDARSAYRTPPAARLLLGLTAMPAEVAALAWDDGRVAFVGWVRDLAEEHNRRADRSSPPSP